MTSEIVIAIVGVVCTGLSGWISHLTTKRKYNTEVDSQQIENMRNAFETYKKMMEDSLESQKKLMDATTEAQNQKIASLEKENENLRSQIGQLQTQMINFLMGKSLSDIKDGLLPLTNVLKAENE